MRGSRTEHITLCSPLHSAHHAPCTPLHTQHTPSPSYAHSTHYTRAPHSTHRARPYTPNTLAARTPMHTTTPELSNTTTLTYLTHSNARHPRPWYTLAIACKLHYMCSPVHYHAHTLTICLHLCIYVGNMSQSGIAVWHNATTLEL